METKEIMQNTEVMDLTEEIVTTGPSKGVKIAAGIGLAAVVSALAYKFVAKPIITKIKAKKEQANTIECDNYAEVETVDED